MSNVRRPQSFVAGHIALYDPVERRLVDSGYAPGDLGGGGGGGAVTSVFGLTGAVMATAVANRVVAGPTSGGAAAPTMRALVADDIPTLTLAKISDANLTGPITSVGNATSIAAQTGTGSTIVVATSPTLVTPALGVATATSINKVAVTAPATGATLTIADGASLITAGAFAVTITATATTGVTLPVSGTLVTLSGTESLSSKTLTFAKIVNNDGLMDANNNEYVLFTQTTSAVNQLRITNAATGNGPSLAAEGGDTDVDLVLDAKGAGKVRANQALVNTVATLTDAATIATDASLSKHFKVTLEGNRTLGNPTNGEDREIYVWDIKQDATGSRTLTLDTKFRFGTDITSITLTTTAAKKDKLTCQYDVTDDKWDVVAFVKGY